MEVRLLTRELLRDFGNDRVDLDLSIVFKEQINRNARFICDHHPKGLEFLIQWCEGYSLPEIARMHRIHNDIVKSSLQFSFELIGRRLQLEDYGVVNKVPPQLQPAARAIFKAYYSTFVELRSPHEEEEKD